MYAIDNSLKYKVFEYRVIVSDEPVIPPKFPNPLKQDGIISKLTKEKIKSKIERASDIEKWTLKDFVNYLNNETNNFSEFDKAYSLFYWIYKNISFDSHGTNIKDTDFEKIYKSKKLGTQYLLPTYKIILIAYKCYKKHNKF